MSYKWAKPGPQLAIHHCWCNFKVRARRRVETKGEQEKAPQMRDTTWQSNCTPRPFFYCTFPHLSVLPAGTLIWLVSIKHSTSAAMLCHPLQCHSHESFSLQRKAAGQSGSWAGRSWHLVNGVSPSCICFSTYLNKKKVILMINLLFHLQYFSFVFLEGKVSYFATLPFLVRVRWQNDRHSYL